MPSFIFKLMALFLEAFAGLPGLRDRPCSVTCIQVTMNKGLVLLVYPKAGAARDRVGSWEGK